MIKGDRVNIRLINENDLDFLRESRNKYRDNFFTHDYISKQQQKAWYEKYKSVFGKDLMFVIQTKDGTKIGAMSIYNIDTATRIADFGRMFVITEYQGEGYAKEAIELLVDFAFNTLRLWKLKLAVFLDNSDAIALYNSVGFKSIPRPTMIMEASNEKKNPNDPMVIPSWIEEEEYDTII